LDLRRIRNLREKVHRAAAYSRRRQRGAQRPRDSSRLDGGDVRILVALAKAEDDVRVVFHQALGRPVHQLERALIVRLAEAVLVREPAVASPGRSTRQGPAHCAACRLVGSVKRRARGKHAQRPSQAPRTSILAFRDGLVEGVAVDPE
jgi:hypothetical protein